MSSVEETGTELASLSRRQNGGSHGRAIAIA